MARGGVFVLVLTVMAGCSEPSAPVLAQRYPIRGQLLSVQLDTGQVVLKHDAVAGFMDAMTMPFTVADRADILSRRPGDLVTATLVVEPTRAFLEDVVLTGSAPLPAGVGDAPLADGARVLMPGDAVPALALTANRASRSRWPIGRVRPASSPSSTPAVRCPTSARSWIAASWRSRQRPRPTRPSLAKCACCR